MINTHNNKKVWKMPAGKYYLGDPCYVWPDDRWDDFCDQYFQLEQVRNPPIVDTNGYGPSIALSTAWGDGEYPVLGTLKDLSVDAGLIGLVPYNFIMEHGKQSGLDLGLVVEFDSEIDVIDEEGILHFGEYRVDTVLNEEDNYDYDEDYDPYA